VVAQAIIEAMETLEPTYPKVDLPPGEIVIE
jgi:hypothetical protein